MQDLINEYYHQTECYIDTTPQLAVFAKCSATDKIGSARATLGVLLLPAPCPIVRKPIIASWYAV